jgi:hypothetical protein
MEAEPRRRGAPWDSPPRQAVREEHLYSSQRRGLTPVYGTAQPPRGASGFLRRAAYRIPEHRARRWMLLMLADRVDVMEHRVPELLRGEGWHVVARRVRANPAAALALAAGALYLLKRSGAVDALADALPSRGRPG